MDWNQALVDAAAEGNVAKIQEALSNGADVNVRMRHKELGAMTALQIAARKNHLAAVTALLAVPSINVNLETGGETALSIACHQGHLAIVSALLSVESIDVNKGSPLGMALLAYGDVAVAIVTALIAHPSIDVNAKIMNTDELPLTLAVQNGYAEIVLALLAKPGIDVNKPSHGKRTALSIAINHYRRNPAIISALLATPSIDVNKGKPRPLSAAIKSNDTALVSMLLAMPGIDTNDSSYEDKTPLFIAVEKGNKAIVEALLANPSTDVNKISKAGSTPLMQAIFRNHNEIAIALLAVPGIEVNTPRSIFYVDSGNNEMQLFPHTPLFFELQKDYPSPAVVAALLAVPGIDLNGVDPERRTTPLTQAIMHKQLPFVQMLIAAGADVNHPDGTPLILAMSGRATEIVAALLAVPSIEVNVTTSDGVTPLHLACAFGFTEIVMLLLGREDIDVNAVTGEIDHYQTALQLAINENKNLDVFNALIARGADVTHMDMEGMTALHSAASWSYFDYVNALLEAGAPPDHPDANGHTALQYAAATVYGDPTPIIEELVRYGADVNHVSDWGTTALENAAMKDFAWTPSLVLRLLALGADPDISITHPGRDAKTTVRKLAEEGFFADAVNDIFVPPAVWKGFTRSDVEKLDTIFDTTTGGDDAVRPPAENWSLCPVCLGFVERESGCKYMTHDCRQQGQGWFHRKLFARFRDEFDRISWCTVCNRICAGHRHFKLFTTAAAMAAEGTAEAASVEVVDIPPVTDTAVFFTSDCIAEGGGGLTEKLLRFRQFKETALGLGSDSFVGKVPFRDAMSRLVEHMWDAPLSDTVTADRVAKMRAEKAFNVATADFPANATAAAEAAGPLLNHRRPAADSLKPFVAPVGAALAGAAAAVAENVIGAANTGDVIFFRHMQLDGTPRDHLERAEGIGKDALGTFVAESIKSFGIDPHFGKCPFHSADCGALLFPDEITEFVPKELADRYFEAFNRVYEKRKKAGVAGYTVPGTPVAVGGAGLAGGGGRGHATTRKTHYRTRKTRRRNRKTEPTQ